MIAAGREMVEIREFLPLRIRSFRPDVAGAGLDRDFVGSARHKETIRVHDEVGVDPFQSADCCNLLGVETLHREKAFEVFFQRREDFSSVFSIVRRALRKRQTKTALSEPTRLEQSRTPMVRTAGFGKPGFLPCCATYRLTRHWPPSTLKFCVMVSVLLPFLSLVVFFTVKVADGPSTTSRPLALIAAEYCSSV